MNKRIIDFTESEFKLLIKEAFEETYKTSKTEKTPGDEKPISQRETAKLLNISIPTLQKYREAGKIPYHRTGKRIIYFKSEVLEATKHNDLF